MTGVIRASGQTTIDYRQLNKSWTQGQINEEGNVIRAEVNRGGWYQLDIQSDSTIIFSDPFSCGFGKSRTGKWTINKIDSTITFHFRKRIGSMNSPGTYKINEVEIYKIEKMTADELILKKVGQEKTFPLLRSELIKN